MSESVLRKITTLGQTLDYIQDRLSEMIVECEKDIFESMESMYKGNTMTRDQLIYMLGKHIDKNYCDRQVMFKVVTFENNINIQIVK